MFITPIDRFLNRLRRPGFFIYIGLVVGALGWTWWDIRRMSKLIEEERKEEKEKRKKKD